MIETGMKVKLRKGSRYFQDFSGWVWNDNDSPIFTVEEKGNHGWWCRAPGYGVIGDYGNGRILAAEDQLEAGRWVPYKEAKE